MQIILMDIVPIARSDDVRHRIRHIVYDHLRHSGCTGCEIKQHRVVPVRLGALPGAVILLKFFCIIKPPFACPANKKLGMDIGIFPTRLLDIFSDIAFAGTDAGCHACRFEAVYKIVRRQQICCRHTDCSDFMQSEHRKPEFIVAFKHQKDHIAFFNAVIRQHLGAFVGVQLHLAKRKRAFLTRHIAPDHRTAIRIKARDLVYHVVGKIEVIRHHRLKRTENTVVIKCLTAKPFIKIFHFHQLCSPLLLSSFITTAKNTHGSPPAAIIPCLWPES